MAALSPEQLSDLPQQRLWDLWDSARRYGWYSYVSVGSGYALRAVVGLLLASGNSPSANFWTVFMVAWALGTGGAAAGWRRELSGAFGTGRIYPGPRKIIHPGVLAKPHVVWIATQVEPPDRPNTVFKIIDNTWTREGERFSLFSLLGQRRSPWRIAYAIALISIGTLVRPAGNLSLPLLLLTLLSGLLLLFAPPPIGPSASITSSWSFLVLAPGLPLALAYFSATDAVPAIQASLLTIWVLLTVRQEEAAGNLLTAILGPEKLERGMKLAFGAVATALHFVIRILLGGEFAKATLKVFGRS